MADKRFSQRLMGLPRVNSDPYRPGSSSGGRASFNPEPYRPGSFMGGSDAALLTSWHDASPTEKPLIEAELKRRGIGVPK